jgi:hypothetical protein
MAQIYEVKQHVSYAKREKNDKMVDMMKDQLLEGNTMKKLQKEEKAISNFVKNKEKHD